ncbi:MAG TPA: cation:proton antiporter [bacterium]|nr:cation:proton antiporter [bacterium]HPG46756.1 cation:proton antiporter [bacterium]HPM98914.1 cation:proton antiporter [bacterium]
MQKIIAFLSLFLLFLPSFALAMETTNSAAEPNMTHRMMMLAIQLGLIMVAARVGGNLFDKLKLPAVLGELCAGMLIGPYALGSLPFSGFPQGLFPLYSSFPVSPELYGFATIASILLLFIVGLETDVNLFRHFYRAGVAVGLGGVIVSFLFGVMCMVTFAPYVLGYSIDHMHPSALFLGAISSATSVGITARILSDKRQIGSPEGVTILAGAVIDDVLGIVVLAIVLGVINVSQTGGVINWSDIQLIAARAIGIWLIATIAGLAISGRISTLLKRFQGKVAIALIAFSLALLLAGMFEQVGLAMIIGAYVMGLSLSKTDINHVVQEQLHNIYSFLVPIFFCVMGMLVNFKAISSVPLLIFGFVYSVMAILAKVIGCGVPALFFNFNLRGALRIGFGMLPRGEVALIMAGVGLATGAFAPEMFGVAVLMVVITTMAAPPILVKLLKSPKKVMRKQIKIREIKELVFPFPNEEVTALLTNKVLKIIEAEGFFVSLIDVERQQYQMRRENIVINFTEHPSKLVFNCDETEIQLINAFMYEVIAEMEKTIQSLQKPIDKEKISKQLLATDTSSMKKYSLAEYLSPGMILANLAAKSKEGVIKELLTVLSQAGKIASFDEAWAAIWEREKSMSTGMEFGIAIPHARTDCVSQIVCAIGIKHEGIDFDSIDGKPAQIFVLILTPKSKHSPFLQFLSQVSRTLSDAAKRGQLLEAKDAQEIFQIMTHSGENAAKK